MTRIHPEDLPHVEETLGKAIRERTNFEVQYRLVRPDESTRYHTGLGHPVVKKGGELEFVGTVVDITERKRAEEALQNAQAELAHFSRVPTVSTLITSIAHELRQPLAAIVADGGARRRWLEREPPDLDEARKAAERVIDSGMRAVA